MKINSVQFKILIFFGLSIFLLFGLITGFQIIQIKQQKLVTQTTVESKKNIINHVIRFKSEKYLSTVSDNSAWDEMVKFTDTLNTDWAVHNIDYMIETFKLSFVIVLDTAGEVYYKSNANNSGSNDYRPNPNHMLQNFRNSAFCNFYFNMNDRIIQVFGAKIVPSSDITYRKQQSSGYLLIGKTIDPEVMEEFSIATNMQAELLTNTSKIDSIQINQNKIITITKPLYHYDSTLVGMLHFSQPNPLQSETRKMFTVSIILTILSILIFVLMFVVIRKLVTNPLNMISKALNTENTNVLATITTSGTEFGSIARLINRFFDQKNHLIEVNTTLSQQKEEILVQNEILQQQKEEITAQAENLEELNHKINNQYDILTQQTKTLEIKHLQLTELNTELSVQNEIIAKKNKEITSSINYAQHIQSAILNAQDTLENVFDSSFIFYQPKDIVGGDFYFVKRVNNFITIAVGDCTGHGVPGALLCTMSIAFLNDIVRNANANTAGITLDLLRKEVQRALGQTGKRGENKDGLDVAFIGIDTETLEMQYAGAYHPLILVRNNQLIEFKADRMPISIYLLEQPYKNHLFRLQKGDQIYMFSDGYADQTGGVNGRKLLISRFKQMLIENTDYPMEVQKTLIMNFLDNWMQGYRQIDDITVFGLKI